MDERLKLYGTDWCPKTALLKNFLQGEWIEFDYYNVDTDENAREVVKKMHNGNLYFPTVSLGDLHLKNPKIQDLRSFLKSR